MARLCRSLVQVCWGLGLLCLLGGVVFRLVPILSDRTSFTSRGGLILAGVLFLCSLATREVERTVSPGS
jgi:hypothetical protein